MKYGTIVGSLVLSILGGCASDIEVRGGPQAIHPSNSQPNQILTSADAAKPLANPASGSGERRVVELRSGQAKAVRTAAPTQRKVSRRAESKRTTVQIGGSKVTWNDFTNVYNRGSRVPSLQDGEGVYMFSRTIQSQYTLSNGTSVDSSQCYSKFLRTTDDALRSEYLKCQNASNRAAHTAPLEDLVSLARQAVQAEGSCAWLGYDRAFDLSARSVGAIASATDKRLFFAKLRCGR